MGGGAVWRARHGGRRRAALDAAALISAAALKHRQHNATSNANNQLNQPTTLTTPYKHQNKTTRQVHRLLLVALKRRREDDRDHYANKRLDLGGPLLSGLFRLLFRKLCKDVRAYVQRSVDAGKEVRAAAGWSGWRLSLCRLLHCIAGGGGSERGSKPPKAPSSPFFDPTNQTATHHYAQPIYNTSTPLHIININTTPHHIKQHQNTRSTCPLPSRRARSPRASSTRWRRATGGSRARRASRRACRRWVKRGREGGGGEGGRGRFREAET